MATAQQQRALGAYGERIAARHLVRLGMVVLDRNRRCKAGERRKPVCVTVVRSSCALRVSALAFRSGRTPRSVSAASSNVQFMAGRAEDIDELGNATRLLDLWNSRQPGPLRSDVSGEKQPKRILAVYAFARHVHVLSETALDLFAQGTSWLAAMPILRSAYECALVAQWAALTQHSPDALLDEQGRSDRAMTKALSKAASPHLRNAKIETYAEFNNGPTRASESVRSFEKLCADLMPEGSDKYLHYRFMSPWVHPSVVLIDQYLDHAVPGDPRSVGPIKDLRPPDELSYRAWRGLTAASMLWAHAALDHVERGHPSAAALTAIGIDLQVSPMLALTPAARDKYFEEARATRRRNWRGPKKKIQ